MTDVAPGPHPVTIERRSWRLIRGIDIPTGATITARFSGGTVTGSTGANRYRAEYRLSGPSLRMGPAVTTGMAGDPTLERSERDFLTLLDAVSGFRMDPSSPTLVLMDDAGDDALTFKVVPDVAEELVGRWTVRLVRRDADLVPTTSGTTHLAFDGTGQVTGSIGMNRVRGTARTDDGRLYLGTLIATGMAGTPGEMDEEAALMAALENVQGYETDDAELTLLDADGTTLVRLDRA